MPLIIAFGHEKRVGKDTAAGFMITHMRTTHRNVKAVKRGFSDKLKDICFQLYSWSGLMPADWYEIKENEHLREKVLPLIGMSPRQIWIAVGNRMREVYPKVWIDYLLKQRDYNALFIKDLRYPNEADAILNEGGFVYKIVNPNVVHTSDEADDALLEYTRWSGTLYNDSDLKVFHSRCCSVFNEIYKP